ncbi:MAG TPA: 50S ribosomal protein L6 [Spirochaetota bacterium]|nr:50S ribosomal protein L6 [Spirochaetota bacterium]HOR44024.1 50S ribosomal protein L6 [Spirochaetota bacterium]HPK56313.1 50S ribosomal protein L6 [Spirochaetota bacterium]
MSRIGKMPINLPSGVNCEINGSAITVSGPLGTDSCSIVSGIKVVKADNILNVEIADITKESECKASHGLMRALINNMVTGVSKGFEQDLEIQGVGFRVQQSGEDLQFHLGFSHPVIYKTRTGIKLKAVDATHLKISGYNKQVVGQVAAEIRELKKPEPYKGKGIRYQGENVRRKAGKSGKK